MLQSLVPKLAQLDPRLLIVLAVIAVIFFIVSLVKKAVKAGKDLLIVALLFGGGVPMVNKIRENYGISYNKQTDTLELKMSGKSFSLPIEEIKNAKNYSIKLDRGGTTTKVSLYYERSDGTAVSERGDNAISIPNFMVDTVLKYLDKNDLEYTLETPVIS